MNSLAVKDVDNEVLADADEYLRKHKICELFEVSSHALWLHSKKKQPHLCFRPFSIFFKSSFANRVYVLIW